MSLNAASEKQYTIYIATANGQFTVSSLHWYCLVVFKVVLCPTMIIRDEHANLGI